RLRFERLPLARDVVGQILSQGAVLGPDRSHGLAHVADAVPCEPRPGSTAMAPALDRQVVQIQIGGGNAGARDRAYTGVRKRRTDKSDFNRARGPPVRPGFA